MGQFLDTIPFSGIIRIRDMMYSVKDPFRLDQGDVSFDAPDSVKAAMRKAIDENRSHYLQTTGLPRLLELLAEKLKTKNRIPVGGPDEVMVTTGGIHALYIVCQALLEPGDEVIIPAPYWVSYPDIAMMAGAVPVIVFAGAAQEYKITPQQLEAAITPRTRLLMINSPCNPTGATYTRHELTRLGEVLMRFPDVMIATDDIYEKIYWGDQPFSDIVMATPKLYDRTVVIHGVSKTYAMTGWRIGYGAGPEPLIQAMKKVQEQITSNPSSISQKAATAALTGDQRCVGEMAREFQKRHDVVLKGLNALPGVRCVPATGAFYAFPDCRQAIEKLKLEDDAAFCEYLIEEAGVALVPGGAFGAPGHARLSYATSMDNLHEALNRLRRVIKE